MSEAENANTRKEKQELVSGLVDDQLSEIEIHKLLRRHDEETRDNFIRYGQIRAAARKETLYSASAHVALHERISAAVAVEDDDQDALSGMPASLVGRRSRKVPFTGLAVAASLVVAVTAGFYLGGGNRGVTGANVAEVSKTMPAGAVAAQPVSTSAAVDPARVQAGGGIAGQTLPAQALSAQTRSGRSLPVLPASPVLAQPASTELRELDPSKQDRLRAYLNRHDRVSRMNPNVRVVSNQDRQ